MKEKEKQWRLDKKWRMGKALLNGERGGQISYEGRNMERLHEERWRKRTRKQRGGGGD